MEQITKEQAEELAESMLDKDFHFSSDTFKEQLVEHWRKKGFIKEPPLLKVRRLWDKQSNKDLYAGDFVKEMILLYEEAIKELERK